MDKFTGDGVMALFGAPIAHEDSEMGIYDLSRSANSRRCRAERRRTPTVQGRPAQRASFGCEPVGLGTGEPLDPAAGDVDDPVLAHVGCRTRALPSGQGRIGSDATATSMTSSAVVGCRPGGCPGARTIRSGSGSEVVSGTRRQALDANGDPPGRNRRCEPHEEALLDGLVLR